MNPKNCYEYNKRCKKLKDGQFSKALKIHQRFFSLFTHIQAIQIIYFKIDSKINQGGRMCTPPLLILISIKSILTLKKRG